MLDSESSDSLDLPKIHMEPVGYTQLPLAHAIALSSYVLRAERADALATFRVQILKESE